MRKIAIVSTKGGVGKTTVTAQTAMALARRGFTVGALDLDSSSPTLHLAFGLTGIPQWGLDTANSRILPSKLENGLELVTMATFWGDKTRVSWRGTQKGDLTRQMLSPMVGWRDDMDYLCIDSPPSMSEEIFILADDKQVSGYIIVTQPQPMSIADIERLADFCRAERLPLFGLISNFDGCIAPSGEVFFPYLGARVDVKEWAESHKIPFLCSIPQSNDVSLLTAYYDEIARQITEGAARPLPNYEARKALRRGALKIFMEEHNAGDLDLPFDKSRA